MKVLKNVLSLIIWGIIVSVVGCNNNEEGSQPQGGATISEIPDQQTTENVPVDSIIFSIGHETVQISNLVVSAVSDYQSLIPDDNIEIFGTGAERSITVTPEENEFGTALITVNVFDGSITSKEEFRVQVKELNIEWDTVAGISENHLNDVLMIEETTLAWVVGDNGTFYKTENGINWIDLETGLQNENFTSLFFTNSIAGHIASESGRIYTSLDGGLSLELQYQAEVPLNGIYSILAIFVWSCGDNGQIIVSNDGGVNWFTRFIPGGENLNDIYFTEPNIGFAVGEGGSIYGSASGGADWIRLNSQTSSNLNSVHFIDSNIGWVCGENNTLKKTVNGGNTWADFKLGNAFQADNWKDVYFIDENIGWVVGVQGRVYNTRDGGSTWDLEGNISEENLNGIFIVDDQTGLIVGENGTLLKYMPLD